MNKLYKWCLLSCMAATLSSCNDFLTEENPSGLTADTFYKTESGAEALINSCYTPLRFWYGQEYATSMTKSRATGSFGRLVQRQSKSSGL